MRKTSLVVATIGAALWQSTALATVRITEWMYNGLASGSVGEFVEFTNIGNSAVDMTGWSFDDDSRNAGTISLSAFGTVAPGESVILTDQVAGDFIAAWSLSASVKVIGGNTANLSRSDEINLFDASTALVDRLTYSDQNFPGTIRTQAISGNPASSAAVGANDVAMWQLSALGDAYGSVANSAGDVGNPGRFPVPEPAAGSIAAIALALAAARRRRIA